MVNFQFPAAFGCTRGAFLMLENGLGRQWCGKGGPKGREREIPSSIWRPLGGHVLIIADYFVERKGGRGALRFWSGLRGTEVSFYSLEKRETSVPRTPPILSGFQ